MPDRRLPGDRIEPEGYSSGEGPLGFLAPFLEGGTDMLTSALGLTPQAPGDVPGKGLTTALGPLLGAAAVFRKLGLRVPDGAATVPAEASGDQILREHFMLPPEFTPVGEEPPYQRPVFSGPAAKRRALPKLPEKRPDE